MEKSIDQKCDKLREAVVVPRQYPYQPDTMKSLQICILSVIDHIQEKAKQEQSNDQD